MDGVPFIWAGANGSAAALTWQAHPYSGRGLTQRACRALSVGAANCRTRIEFFWAKTGELVVRAVGCFQALIKPGATYEGTRECGGALVAITSDGEGCIVTVTLRGNDTIWERSTIRWSDRDTHSVASAAVREAEELGRTQRLEAVRSRRPRRWGLFGG